jgi:5-oxoprolinase (ATP-hydrolysing)
VSDPTTSSGARSGEWRLWVATGGTFTDCLAVDPGGALHRAKVLSSGALRGRLAGWAGRNRVRFDADWRGAARVAVGAELRWLLADAAPLRVVGADASAGVLELRGPTAALGDATGVFELRFAEEAPIVAARVVTRTPPGVALPPIAMRLATTRGTNALLERTGVPPVLFVTRGFRDLLRIGDQRRPELFALRIERPAPLSETVVEVPERLAADGSVLERIDLDALSLLARQLAGRGHSVAAVALMHSYVQPRHEALLAELLRGAGFAHVSVSSSLAPFAGFLHRAETAVVDAYLGPVLEDYLRGVRASLEGGPAAGAAVDAGEPAPARPRLHVMTSAGGLVRADAFHAKDALLSGPAGGVVGAWAAGRRAGFDRVIAFDMGGTSTDVARIDGDYEYVWEHRVGAARLVAPALAIESVAAGGGSVCRVDGDGFAVGPESAGAVPGPACYGMGGPLTVTDVNLLLGRLKPARFGIPVDVQAAGDAAAAFRLELRERRGGDDRLDEPALLEGVLALADERMADAIRRISLRRGYDPADYALVAFGGAGPQHACAVAESLGIRSVVVPPDAGLLSALGIGRALLERFAERQLLRPLAELEPDLPSLLAELEAEAVGAVAAEGVGSGEVDVRRRIVSLRFRGQDSTLELDWAPAGLAERFADRYLEVYGHAPHGREVEAVALRVVASAAAEPEPADPPPAPHAAEPAGRARTWLAGAWREIPGYERGSLRPGARVPGPALVWEDHSATLVGAGWTGEVDGGGALVLRKRAAVAGASDDRPAAVREELFVHRFEALVGEMGEQLRRTAISVNVRERLDFSCALLDVDGELVVNAPHIPVHLGALGECVRSVAAALPLEAGDFAVTNHPAYGGSHLPDVTVVAPVHDAAGSLVGYVANRAHHAEIGGARPGSMPPGARRLADEGTVIPPLHLVRGGEDRFGRVEALLRGGRYPSRAVEENLADLRAQVAAARRGALLLRELADGHGRAAVAGYMDALKARAERRIRGALGRLPPGEYRAIERLDDGSELAATVRIEGDHAVIDFAGSAPEHPGNLNATPAIVRSVVLYVLRLLVDEPLPLNEGLLRAVSLHVPPGILNPSFGDDPATAPAVVGGNVETSQRLTDTLLRALGLVACSQGTMNNVLFGDGSFGYYETVGGGAGAGPGWAGADAVHNHMTNTRITDPEILELRYPVRVEQFGIRRGSGGAGRWHGGDGIVREIRFLKPVSLSVLTQHRVERPYGMAGGAPGAAGRQRVIRASGATLALGPIDGCEVEAGDRLVLETPGGGGWGEA